MDLTDRLGLRRHDTSDAFDVADYAYNWSILDAAPGVLVSHSASLPVWTPDQEGRHVWVADKQALVYWDGAAFRQVAPRGLLNKAVRSTDLVTTSTAYTAAVTATATLSGWPRSLLIIVDAPRVTNSVGIAGLAIYQGASLLIEWPSGQNASPAQRAAPYAYPADPPGGSSVSYSFRVRADPSYGGTTAVIGRCSISVIEV